jgi:tRNA dimethylallyltransferase
MKNKICIVLVGPTAVGKTSLAIDLAQNLKTDILSTDSRQCYQELNIGVAKPTPLQLEAVHHYFINSHSINEDINAKVFEKYALEKVNEIFSAHDIAIVVGGTGLYVKAFCEGIDEIPQIDKNIREKIIAEYETNGLEWLQNEVRRRDPEYFKVGEIQNPQRMIRALEVMLSTGNSILSFQSKEKKQRDFTILKIGLDLPRQILYDNINRRVDEMIKEGLVEEARTLFPNKQLNALQTVGYRELFEYFEGTTSLEKAIENIKTNTRHYAKRQLTWFRKDTEIKWLNSTSALPDILSSLRQFT